MRRVNYLFPIGALVISIGILGWRWRVQETQPIRTTGQGIPDAAKSGNVEAAMQQCREVMTVLQQNHWALPNPCPDSVMQMLTLPDHKNAESSFQRHGNVTSIGVTTKDPETALYTAIYARQNRSYYKGDRSQAKPTGFYIVGYKNTGEVKQIPVEQVRQKAQVKQGEDADCFPGESCYASSVPDDRYTHTAKPQ